MASHKNALSYTVEEDTIYGVDFPGGIAEALSRQNYREAVRLLYLQTLKQLSDAERIDWQLYKTPTQYINEVRLPAFRQLTNHFLRVRYGNFEATEELFRLSLIHISEPTRRTPISYAVFCLKKKKIKDTFRR